MRWFILYLYIYDIDSLIFSRDILNDNNNTFIRLVLDLKGN